MSETVDDYGDLLEDAEHRWRNRIIGVAVLAVLIAAGAYALWALVLSGGGSSAGGTQTATVERGSITKTLSTSGTAVAQSTAELSFGVSGVVTAVNVTLEQEVKQGDLLAEIEPDEDLEGALATAEVNLASAQEKLDELVGGASESDLASADQSLLQAQANYDEAESALQDLLDGSSESELLSAELAVASAESQLAKAEESRSNLYSASDDAIAAAEEAVEKAEDALADAKRAADNAATSLTLAEASFLQAFDTYCDTDDHLTAVCNYLHVPLTNTQLSRLSESILDEITAAGVGLDDVQDGADSEDVWLYAAQQGIEPEPTAEPTEEPTEEDTGTNAQQETGPDIVSAGTSLISANSSYKSALASKNSASAAVVSAGADIEAAEDDLEEAKKGPSSAEIAAADVAVGEAQLSLDEAKEKLAELKAGPTQEDLKEAQSKLDQAAAALVVAQAKWGDVYDGTDQLDIELQRDQVRQAELSVERARDNLESVKIIASFDGTVASLDIEVGQEVSGAGAAAIVLHTPDALGLDLTVSESDRPDVEAGQSGFATFDALGDSQFPLVIDSVGSSPTTTQGVVIYEVQATIQSLESTFAARAQSGEVPAGSASPQADIPGTEDIPAELRERFAAGTENEDIPAEALERFAARMETEDKPLPGMNASVTIIVDQAQDVLLVPAQAIQSEGFQSVVEVLNDDGSTEKVVVQTGLTDGMNTEITEGLEEGQTIIIPSRTVTAASEQTTTGPGFHMEFRGEGGSSEGGGPSFYIAPGGSAP
jgi:multidrug efflux pump subunit AcrA (membrane-fusion protein)